MPETFEHRDCSPWNLLVTTSGELAVLDWESAEQNGLPAIDLVYFLAYLAFFMDGAMKTGNFIKNLTATPTIRRPLPVVCRPPANNVISNAPVWIQLRAPAASVDLADPHSFGSSPSIGGCRRIVPRPAALRRSLFYNLVLEELAEDQTPAQASIH